MLEKILMLLPWYRDLKANWEKQNIMLDEQKLRIGKLEKALKEEREKNETKINKRNDVRKRNSTSRRTKKIHKIDDSKSENVVV